MRTNNVLKIIRQASGQGRVRSRAPSVPLIVYVFTSVIPHCGHLEHKLEESECLTLQP